jgi:hypothetical protein
MAQAAKAVKTIDRKKLKANIDRREPFVVVKTLSPEHFRRVHLPGSRNMLPG